MMRLCDGTVNHERVKLFVQKLKITKVDINSGMPFSRASRENGNRFKISNA